MAKVGRRASSGPLSPPLKPFSPTSQPSYTLFQSKKICFPFLKTCVFFFKTKQQRYSFRISFNFSSRSMFLEDCASLVKIATTFCPTNAISPMIAKRVHYYSILFLICHETKHAKPLCRAAKPSCTTAKPSCKAASMKRAIPPQSKCCMLMKCTPEGKALMHCIMVRHAPPARSTSWNSTSHGISMNSVASTFSPNASTRNWYAVTENFLLAIVVSTFKCTCRQWENFMQSLRTSGWLKWCSSFCRRMGGLHAAYNEK